MQGGKTVKEILEMVERDKGQGVRDRGALLITSFWMKKSVEIKKNPAQTGGPDPKNGVQSEEILFFRSV